MKLWLGFANMITVIIGLAQAIVGVLMMVHPSFSFASGTIAYVMLGIGLLILLVSVYGACAACKDCAMCGYAFLITVVFVGELAALILAAVSGGAVLTEIANRWSDLPDNNKDSIGLAFGCCAVADQAMNGGAEYADCSQKSLPGARVETRFGAWCDSYPLNALADGTGYSTFSAFSDDGQACIAKNEANSDDNTTCSALAKQDTCDANDKCTWTTSTRCGGANFDAMCRCPKKNMGDGTTWHDYNAKTQCEPYNDSTIPYCRANDGYPTPRNVGWEFFMFTDTDNKVAANTVPAPVANCYAKAESVIKDNMYIALGVAAGFFVWMLLLVVFSWCLTCSMEKESSGGYGYDT